jgi:hypothetical protein
MRNETDSRNRFHRLGYILRWRLESYSSVTKTPQPGLKIAFSRCLGGLWDKRHSIPETLQAMDEPLRYPLAIALIEVVAAQVAVDRSLCQHVVGDDQDRVGDGDRGLRPATTGCQASVLRR